MCGPNVDLPGPRRPERRGVAQAHPIPRGSSQRQAEGGIAGGIPGPAMQPGPNPRRQG